MADAAAVAEKPAAAAQGGNNAGGNDGVAKADAAAASAAAAPAKDAAAAPAAEAKKDEGTILGGDPAKADAKKDEGSQKQGAPEKYADFKLPEGVTPDTKVMDEFRAEAKALNLSQEAAQKLVDFQARQSLANAKAIEESYVKQSEAWKEEAKTLFGAEWQKEFGIASKAVERFGSPALRQLLNESRLGNHPEWVRFCNTIGKAISEDSQVDGKRAGGERKSDAEVLYPTMGKK